MICKYLSVSFLLLALCGFSFSAYAQKASHECMIAADATDYLKNWNALYGWFELFKSCDNQSGEIPEGFSDSVVKLLAKDWGQFPQLITFSDENPEFRKFILSHIDSTDDWDKLETAVKNAQERCPENGAAFCAEIAKLAKASAKEARSQ